VSVTPYGKEEGAVRILGAGDLPGRLASPIAVVAGLMACLVFATIGSAQTTTGRISGTVNDSSGGVLPGVSVTVTQDGTGLSRTTSTDTRGGYVFVDLPVGTYSVKVELSGFKTSVKSGYTLVADGRVSVDFALDVGAVTEMVEVSAPGETVNTTSGEIGRVVDREQVQNLALNGRNYMQLATLVPGAPVLDTNALNIMVGLGINTSINGSRTNTSLLTVDGGFNMDSGSNNSQISNVGIDFIEQVSLKTSNFSAEYGRNSGATINVVTRSGTNAFHGSAYEYARNERLDANDFFSNAAQLPKAKLRYNNFGWSFGGAAIKDKLFFFGGEEWKQIRRLTPPTLRTLPTSAMQRGDFSGITTVIRDPRNGQPFQGNIIPPDRITADGRAIAALYAAMSQAAISYTDRPITNNALFQNDNPFDFRQDLIRLDWQATSNQRYTVRLLFDDYNTIEPGGTFINSQLPTVPTDRRRPGRNFQVSHAWTARNNLVNEFRANASWNGQRIPPVGEAWMRDTYGFTFPQLYSDGGRFENSIPNTTIAGYASFSGASGSLLSPTTDIAVSDTVSWLKGAHTFRFGGIAVRNRKDQNGRSQYAGQVAFNTTGNTITSGQAFADALLGNFRTYTEAQLDPMGFFRFWQYEGFATDNWRIKQNLSIEYGFRVQYHVPTYTQANNMASFDPAHYDPSRAITVLPNGTLVAGTGDRFNGLVRPGDGVPESELGRVPNGDDPIVLAVPAGAPQGFYDAQANFAPRVSVAWSPGESGSTAIRGGVGLFLDRPEGNLYFPLVNNAPYSLSANYENGNLATPGGGAVPALAPLGSIDSIDPNLKIPRVWQYSVSIQRELRWGIFGEIGYVGSTGEHLIRQPDINQPSFDVLAANAALPAAQRANTNFLRPFKGYSNIRMRLSDSSSQYNALQVFLSRRRGDLTWTASYTLGASNDNASGNGDNPEDYLNQDYNWGPSNFDRRHILVGTWTWELPIFRDQTGIGRVLGGWAVSGIYRYQTGAPLTITANTSIGNRRADYLGTEPYIPESDRRSPAGPILWLDPAAFAAAPDSRLGDSERGQFRGPSYQVLDLSLRKEFRLYQDVRLQFQADLFNALNHTNFNDPQTNMANADFGRISAAGPPRNVQLALRLMF
jgi:Carboxypeptidase regulatory-like domain